MMDILIDVALDQKDKIVISLKYPGIYITQGDNRLQTLVFDRPEIFEQAECVIQFYNSSGSFDEQNIGQSNEFEILNTLTQSTSISFNIYYIIDNVKTQHSNNLLLSIRPSMRALDPTIPIEELPRAVLPTGGTDGQVLAKRSVKNFDTEWIEQTGSGGSSTIAWLPEVSTDGDISFKRSNTTVPPSIVNIMGPAGKDGTDGADGKDGEPGPPGTDGIDGKDGERGEDGAPGPAGKDGIDGPPGVDGKSAYEIALEKGFVGTEEEWLASLQGKDGAPGPAGADGKDGIGVAFWDKEDFGVEYKTNKIRNGKQVYKMLVDCGTITSTTTQGVQVNTDIPLNISNVKDIWITDMQGDIGSVQRNPLPIIFADSVNTPANYIPRRTIAYILKTPLSIRIGNTSTNQILNVIALIEYTKTIDTPETPGPFIIEGLTEIAHDDTLSGKGTVDEPLSVIGGAATAGQVIGVSGTLERKALDANKHGKLKFIPNDGNVEDINANGEWICPKDGRYTLSANGGAFSAASTSTGFFQLNEPNTVVAAKIMGLSGNPSGVSSSTANITVQLKKGDNISYWVYSTADQTITSNPSQFSITLQASIDITVDDMYQQWLDNGNEGTYEEFLQAVWNVSIGESKYIQGNYKNMALAANVGAKPVPVFNNTESFAEVVGDNIKILEKGLYTLTIDLGSLTPSSSGVIITGIYGPNAQRASSAGQQISTNTPDFHILPLTFIANPGDIVYVVLHSTVARTSIVSATDAYRQLKFTLIKHGSMGEKTDLISSDENNALLLGSDDKLFVPANGSGYVEYLYNTDDSANNNSTAFATGEEGVLFPNITTFGTKIQKRVKASRSLKNAKITIEQKNTISDLFFIPSPFTYVIQYAARYGIDILPVSGSEDMIDVGFNANGMTPSGATYGANSSHSWAGQRTAGNVWRVRVEYP